VLEDHPNRPLPHLWGVPPVSCHDRILSRNGVSGNPGAVQFWGMDLRMCYECIRVGCRSEASRSEQGTPLIMRKREDEPLLDRRGSSMCWLPIADVFRTLDILRSLSQGGL